MKIFRIGGGLGNQMFQYLYSLNFIKNEKVYYHINERKDISYHHFFQLDKLGIKLQKPNLLLRIFFCRNKIPILDKMIVLVNIGSFFQKKSFDIIDPMSLKNKLYIEGNFIDPKSAIINKDVFSSFNKTIEKESNFINIAIHLRFGDYLNKGNKKKFVQLTKTNYYENSIKFMRSRFKKQTKFLIVSDDLKKAKSFFENEKNFIYSSNQSAIDDLKILACSQGIITANSTFSFMGAIIGNKKIVCCPNKYLLDNVKINYPSNWNIIDV